MRNTPTSLITWRPSESVFADLVSKHRPTPHSVNAFLVGDDSPNFEKVVLLTPVFNIYLPGASSTNYYEHNSNSNLGVVMGSRDLNMDQTVVSCTIVVAQMPPGAGPE